MATVVGMHEAKTKLSQLVQEVESGGSVTITRNGLPVVELVRARLGTSRGFGAMAGTGSVSSLAWDDVVAGDAEVAALFDDPG